MTKARSAIAQMVPLIGLTLLFVGCSSNPGYELAATSGTETLDGEPLAGAVVNFQPLTTGDKVLGPGSVGRADASGRFSLTTVDDKPGAWVGVHKVRIYSYSPESPVESDVDAGPSQERVPDRYNYQSKLTFEVPAAGTSEANFELQTKP